MSKEGLGVAVVRRDKDVVRIGFAWLNIEEDSTFGGCLLSGGLATVGLPCSDSVAGTVLVARSDTGNPLNIGSVNRIGDGNPLNIGSVNGVDGENPTT